MVYIISYDLCAPGRHYEELAELINKEGAWARLGGSAYLLESNKTAVELRDSFKRILDINDKLYVGIVKAPAAWTGMSLEVSDWIKQRL